MKAEEKRNLVLRIIEYGKEHEPFTFEQLCLNLDIDENSQIYIKDHLISHTFPTSPNHIIATETKYPTTFLVKQIIKEAKLRVLPNALFSYIDHEEIIEARKAAKSARVLSWIAIIISLLTGVGSWIIGYFQLQMSFNNLQGL
jgi:hypothetical protein